MGCYDMIVGNFVCPYCNTVERIFLDQIKTGECIFRDYGLGQQIPGLDYNGVDKGTHNCENCKNDYDYKVNFQSGIMTSIEIKDIVFNKTYTYQKEADCVPKLYTEKDLDDMSNQLKWLKQVVDHNTNKIQQAKAIIKDVEPKIELLKIKISSQVNQKYGL